MPNSALSPPASGHPRHPLSNQEVLFTRQRHEADKMGLHWDYRFVLGDKAYSWATKKEMPEPGKAILLFEQPVHDREYALSPVVKIPPGNYGAGTTTLDWVHKALVDGYEDEPGKLIVRTKDGKQRFLLKKLENGAYFEKYGDKAWLFRNLGTQPSYSEGPDSTFTHNGITRKVDSLIEVAKDKPTKQVSVGSLDWILAHTDVNPTRVREADLGIPIILSNFKGKLAVIDGAHRLTRAKQEGIEKLPTKYVTRKELMGLSKVAFLGEWKDKLLLHPELYERLQKKDRPIYLYHGSAAQDDILREGMILDKAWSSTTRPPIEAALMGSPDHRRNFCFSPNKAYSELYTTDGAWVGGKTHQPLLVRLDPSKVDKLDWKHRAILAIAGRELRTYEDVPVEDILRPGTKEYEEVEKSTPYLIGHSKSASLRAAIKPMKTVTKLSVDSLGPILGNGPLNIQDMSDRLTPLHNYDPTSFLASDGTPSRAGILTKVSQTMNNNRFLTKLAFSLKTINYPEKKEHYFDKAYSEGNPHLRSALSYYDAKDGVTQGHPASFKGETIDPLDSYLEKRENKPIVSQTAKNLSHGALAGGLGVLGLSSLASKTNFRNFNKYPKLTSGLNSAALAATIAGASSAIGIHRKEKRELGLFNSVQNVSDRVKSQVMFKAWLDKKKSQ